MEGRESFFGKILKRFKDRFTSKEIERSKQSGLEILDDIIPSGSSFEKFREIYNQLEYGGSLLDIINETKKHSSGPLGLDAIEGVRGILSEEDECLIVGARTRDEIVIGQVRGFFRTETGVEGIATLVRRTGAKKPVMWMVTPGGKANEYSFRFGYM